MFELAGHSFRSLMGGAPLLSRSPGKRQHARPESLAGRVDETWDLR